MRARLLNRGKTSGRADDNEETIVKRFRTFKEQSQPVIEHFKVRSASHHQPHACLAYHLACWRWCPGLRCMANCRQVSATGCLLALSTRQCMQASLTAAHQMQKQGKCTVIKSGGSPDAVFALVVAAIAKHAPELERNHKASDAAGVRATVPPDMKPAEAPDTPVATSNPASPDAAAAAVTSADDATEGEKGLPEGSKIVFVLGGPGSGKGTQCEKILAEYADLGVHHFSAGAANLHCACTAAACVLLHTMLTQARTEQLCALQSMRTHCRSTSSVSLNSFAVACRRPAAAGSEGGQRRAGGHHGGGQACADGGHDRAAQGAASAG